MEAIAANKVLFFNSNVFPCLSKSIIRYHHHHRRRRHMFVCYLQSRDNQQLKLVTSQETHIVKPVLAKPKPKRKLVELVFIGGLFVSLAGIIWIEGVILPKKMKMLSDKNISSCSSSFEDIYYAYTSGECEFLPIIMLILILKLVVIHEDECTRNRKNVALKVVGVIIICIFVGCSLRLVSQAHVRDTLLSTCGHGPWHLTLALFLILLNISFLGTSVLQDIREQEDRVNTQICVGSGTQAGDLKSRKRSRRPLEKSRRRRIIVLNKHLGEFII